MIDLTKRTVAELAEIDETPLFSEMSDIMRRYNVMHIAAVNAGRKYLNETPRQYHTFCRAM